jgi:hypothetical protein
MIVSVGGSSPITQQAPRGIGHGSASQRDKCDTMRLAPEDKHMSFSDMAI